MWQFKAKVYVWNRKHDETHVVNVAHNVSAADQWQNGNNVFPEWEHTWSTYLTPPTDALCLSFWAESLTDRGITRCICSLFFKPLWRVQSVWRPPYWNRIWRNHMAWLFQAAHTLKHAHTQARSKCSSSWLTMKTMVNVFSTVISLNACKLLYKHRVAVAVTVTQFIYESSSFL